MGFAESYLKKHALFPFQIHKPPHKELEIIIVIPCYNEPDILKTLESLWSCERQGRTVEVLIVVNSAENSAPDIIKQNIETIKKINFWSSSHFDDRFRFYIIQHLYLPKKEAGAGLTRKIGMDEAIFRFHFIGNERGIIACLDADTICDRNYILEITNHFRKFPECKAGIVYFEHPIDGDEFAEPIYSAVIQYELYLRYFVQSLRYSGFPYAYHTIGSTIVVNAFAYIKQGGMNRRKAGEDFYFLQKIIPFGNFHEIYSARVIPSPRPSGRVIFGTGTAVKKLIEQPKQHLLTYSFSSFIDLKSLFEIIEQLYEPHFVKTEEYAKFITGNLLQFLSKEKFNSKYLEIKENSASFESFRKRFFNWFNTFKIIKYLNFCHAQHYQKESIVMGANRLLKAIQLPSLCTDDPKELLVIFRSLERGIFNPLL
ncbi:MAG: glycosyltransferase family 2 protein [Bacteroidia bacterium]|nr:glycosyltransferase family 2 protein [Bacteroidia bacterium]